MKPRILIIFTFLLFSFVKTYGQTATVKVIKSPYPNVANMDSVHFTFNGVSFWGCDTTLKTIPINKGKVLDTCVVIFKEYAIHFLTKFKPNEEYFIDSHCCCKFAMQPKSGKGRKGSVLFKNKTNRELALIAGDNSDTVKIAQRQQILSFESPMCYFKPCNIQLAEPSFLSYGCSHHKDEAEYDRCWEEGNKFILTDVWFHFMHGEKIEVIYDDKSKTSKLKLKGYLTTKERDKLMKKYR